MKNLKIRPCLDEEGVVNSCRMCWENGKWNVLPRLFMYEIEGRDGCYCSDCAKKIAKEGV